MTSEQKKDLSFLKETNALIFCDECRSRTSKYRQCQFYGHCHHMVCENCITSECDFLFKEKRVCVMCKELFCDSCAATYMRRCTGFNTYPDSCPVAACKNCTDTLKTHISCDTFNCNHQPCAVSRMRKCMKCYRWCCANHQTTPSDSCDHMFMRICRDCGVVYSRLAATKDCQHIVNKPHVFADLIFDSTSE